MKYLSLFFVFLTFISPLSANGNIDDANRKKMLNDLNSIKSTFEVKYAPSDWKRFYADWDLEEQIRKAQKQIQETFPITIKDYQHIIRGFFNSTKDYHVRVAFYSTEVAMLPFRIQSADGRYYIVWKASWNPGKTLEAEKTFGKMPFCIGDEVLEFDGKPIEQAASALQEEEYGNPNSATDKLLAETALTYRLGSMGQKVPQGPIEITIRHKDTGAVETYALKWLYQPELISDHTALPNQIRSLYPVKGKSKSAAKALAKPSLENHLYFQKQMTTPIFEQMKAARTTLNKMLNKKKLAFSADRDGEDNDPGFDTLAARKSFVPPLGTIIWESPKEYPLYAYIFVTKENKKIGYVRIPTYDCGQENARIFATIMEEFQQQTEGLVIDQLNNPGGSPFYMYALASMLTDIPLHTPTERVTITQEDVSTALSFLDDEEHYRKIGYNPYEGESLYGYHLNKETWHNIVAHFEFLVNEWNLGRTFTNPAHFFGIDTIQPHPGVRYTKPIVILVNQLDFSCADFFPAILQDNKRALIFGSTTAGAGGFVLEGKFHNKLGISKFWFTGSIAERIDGNPIENLGVAPDVEYRLTQEDLSDGYKGYVQAVLDTLSTHFN
jgi:hypothetical protein